MLLAGPVACGWAEGEGEGADDGPCRDEISGVIDASSPRWNRVYEASGEADLTCQLEAFDSNQDQCPYVALPIHGISSGERLRVEVVRAATTMADTVLYLYCEDFDPAQPDKNLIATNDDFGGEETSGFGQYLELDLVGPLTYYLVLSAFDGVDESGEGEVTGDFGSYQVCLRGDYVFGEYVPEGEDVAPTDCSFDSEFSQPVDLSFQGTVQASNNVAGKQAYDLITGVDDPIVGLRWWGVTGTNLNVPCDPAQLVYHVSFSEKSGLIPGPQIVDATATLAISDSGEDIFGMPIHLFELALAEPVTLPGGEGFVSVFVPATQNGCLFSWSTSFVGTDSTVFNFGSLNYSSNPDSLAFCVVTEPECDKPTDSTYRIQIIDPVGSAVVNNATVTLNGVIPAQHNAQGGFYFFDCLSLGVYTLNVSAPGFEDHSEEIRFTSPFQFDSAFLAIEQEGEPEGCKGCSVQTSVFVTVLSTATEKPITNATVKLVGTLAEVTENVDGIYTFPLLSDGLYTVRAEAPGFDAEQAQIRVNDKPAMNLLLRLDPEGQAEGGNEGEPNPLFNHSSDENNDGKISLSELLGIIQLYNFGQYHCVSGGYAPGAGSHACAPHSSDYLPPTPDFAISLSELLRGIQVYAAQAYYACPGQGEDGYCLGNP